MATKTKPAPADWLHSAVLDRMAALGWNGRRLAAESGVADPQVYRYLAGSRGLNSDALAAILKALGLTLTPP